MPKHRSSRKAVALVDALAKVYKANANASIALGQKKYLRGNRVNVPPHNAKSPTPSVNVPPLRSLPFYSSFKKQFEFWGLRQPTRKLVQRSVFLKHPITKTADLCSAIELLWDKEQREFQLAAIDLALSNRKLWTPDLLTSTFEFMIRNKSWWDTVDAIASSLVGPLVKSQLELSQEEDDDEDEDEEGEEEAVKEEEVVETEGKQKEREEQGELAEEHGEEEREEQKEGQYHSVLDVLDRWNEDENLWIRRTSIIYQLKYKHDTDTQRLFRYLLILSSLLFFYFLFT
ncbi:putative proline glutamate and leucine rich protein 1 [Balamuthia mandrillaris]